MFSLTQFTLIAAAGLAGGFSIFSLVVARQLRWERQRLDLAAMGALETYYCILMVPYSGPSGAEESLFWIRVLSLPMPFVTWLFVKLTTRLANPQRRWMARLGWLTLALCIAFSSAMAVDLLTGSRIIYTHVELLPATPQGKVVRASAVGMVFLTFVSVAFYVSAYVLIRQWRRGDRSLLPLLVGSVLYFLSVTSDFNVIFRLYDAPYLQHFGFLGLFFGYCFYNALYYINSVRALEHAYQEVRAHRDRAQAAEATLERLSEAAMRSQEDERRRLAFALHDGAGQVLAAAALHLDGLAGSELSQANREQLAKVRQLVQGLYDDLRRLSHDLRPLALDRLGLPSALRELAESAATESLQIEVSIDPPGLHPPSDVAVAAFRISQAAIANITQHARASRASIRVTGTNGKLLLEVEDDGRGFDPAQNSGDVGIGLIGMQERAVWLGGQVEVDAAPGRGTRVRVEIPLPR